MSVVATLPNPCLVAILLICTTRTGSGAQILFHYPPDPLFDDKTNSSPTTASFDSEDETSMDSDYSANEDESGTDDDEDFVSFSRPPTGSTLRGLKSKAKSSSIDDQLATASSQQNTSRDQASEPLFGLAEDGLVSLLSPDRTWHKRKFELGINDLIFLGRPVFARPDGSWRRTRERRPKTNSGDPELSETGSDGDDALNADRDDSMTEMQPSNDSRSTTSVKSALTMFHIVFVMNPPPLEHALRVKDMYENVVKKLSRALKWEQCHHDYVWDQCELISAVKSSESAKRLTASALCAEIRAKSSLATAIATIYSAISNSRIASVTLSPKVSVSLQIPPITSTSYLPSLTDSPIQPGLWLTTATDISTEPAGPDGSMPDGLELAKHYTLLLKSPPSRIAKDAIDAGGPLAAHLPKFVASLRPTKSFYKLAASSQISLADIQVLARHLIDWRRAVAVPPLHQRDVYIVSPNADMRKLREATKSYEQQFFPSMPNMPSLPKILSALSGIPKPFGSLIPSTDHKEIYYLALAWLMRNGWVTQLRTFAYIRVDPEVKRLARDREEVTASHAAVPTNAQEDNRVRGDSMKARKRPSIVSRPSSDGKRSNYSNWPKHNSKMASLILNPPRATPEESKWLDLIEELLTLGSSPQLSLTEEDRLELCNCWPRFTRYFNGHVALETLPVREGLKRRDVWNILSKVGMDLEHGVEDENGGNKAILIPVRHW